MIGTDKYAYSSKLRMADPITKILITLGIMFLCIILDNLYVSIATMISMATLNIIMGGHKPKDLWQMFKIPIGFIFIGVITIIIGRYSPETNLILGFNLGAHIYGISSQGIFQALHIFTKAMGIISTVYFLVMNTPMTDITLALYKLKFPTLFVELLELVYRFIFILTETAENIKIAQDSRLGYINMKISYKSTSELISRLFISSYKKADAIYDALESRGYNGELTTVGMQYQVDTRITTAAIVVAGIQVWIYMLM